jgi:hypothetical protein
MRPVLVLGSTLTLLATATPRPAPGPGAVLAMHNALVAALDAGDAEKALTFLDESKEGGWPDGENGGIERPSLMLTDSTGLPVFADGAEEARALLAKLARASRDGGPEWRTKIVRSRSDCHSPELSYATLEFERTRGVKGGTQLWRSTVLARWVDGQWKLFHWHVSPADAETAKLATTTKR